MDFKGLFKTKTFWGGLAGLIFMAFLFINNAATGMEVAATGAICIASIFLRQALPKEVMAKIAEAKPLIASKTMWASLITAVGAMGAFVQGEIDLGALITALSGCLQFLLLRQGLPSSPLPEFDLTGDTPKKE
jgi:hypothetical protein